MTVSMTTDAEENYRTDVLYVPYRTHMLSPAFMRFALLLRGYDFPPRGADGLFRYLELGFGMGNSLVANAAATDGECWGVDFLAGHCDAARKSADAAGVGGRCRILQKTFAEIADRAEGAGGLPLFDVIALHGVWSWVDAANREHILRIIRSRLKRGGVAYVSYNALPGWAVFMPLRDAMLGMMADCAATDPEAGTEAWIRTVMERLVDMASSDGAYFRLNPLCGIYLAEMAKKPPAFLAHDFCNPVWRPFSFRDVAKDFLTAGCGYAASADLFHHVDAFLPPGMAARVREAEAAGADPALGETLRDLAFNTQLRADLFLREGRRLAAGAFRGRLADAVVCLGTALEKVEDFGGVSMDIVYGINKARLDDTMCPAILAALRRAGGCGARIGDLPGGVPSTESGMRKLIECLSIMREAGYIREAGCLP